MDISSIDWQSFLVEVAAAQASHRSSDSFPFFSSSFLESLTVDLSRCPLGSSYSFKGAVKHAQVIACIASCLHRIPDRETLGSILEIIWDWFLHFGTRGGKKFC
ncbi:hypothetical protein PAPYR_8846 [Paratrimastix pyriformis]|uniref:Uncharacterized protein n=1 Tax=Paratrimastix pyriformis TaxID=342808 RepID=A0ABQ8UFB4_9EUKA|nr:hypothetical protein PAPYR_8846 [Paratrimastix pyriformis]